MGEQLIEGTAKFDNYSQTLSGASPMDLMGRDSHAIVEGIRKDTGSYKLHSVPIDGMPENYAVEPGRRIQAEPDAARAVGTKTKESGTAVGVAATERAAARTVAGETGTAAGVAAAEARTAAVEASTAAVEARTAAVEAGTAAGMAAGQTGRLENKALQSSGGCPSIKDADGEVLTKKSWRSSDGLEEAMPLQRDQGVMKEGGEPLLNHPRMFQNDSVKGAPEQQLLPEKKNYVPHEDVPEQKN